MSLSASVMFPALAALVSAIVYWIATGRQPKAAELARLTFLGAIIVLMFVLAGHVVRVGGGAP
jgi:4-amino-4-deoxy-L-arabinose transferase-like glycosyltransferase